jgi:hypothetical protein
MDEIPANDEATYRTEAVLADSLWEFHRDVFSEVLTNIELSAFLRYYPQDLDAIADQFDYRRKLVEEDPHAMPEGRAAFGKLLHALDLDLQIEPSAPDRS